MFDSTVREGVLRLGREGMRCLSGGFDGGFREADAVYNVTVPEGFDRTDLAAYVRERRRRAGFEVDGPTLLTGVSQDHARGATAAPVTAYATVGLSNPAALPVPPEESETAADSNGRSDEPPYPGTVNLVVGTTRSLPDGAAANLLTVAAEAKAATLSTLAGVPGTTSDAVVVASDPAGERAQFTGSATPVGDAARACVREAVRASFESRYADCDPPASVAEAEHGVVTDRNVDHHSP